MPRFRRPLVLLVLALLGLGPAAALAAPEDPAPREASEEERAMIRELVDGLREEAARIRGLAWKRPVPADLLTRDQLRANLEAEIEKEMTPEERARDLRILRRHRMLGADEDPVEMMLEMLEEMVGGYYNPKTERLYLIEGMTGDAQKPVILHELIHALEDQYVDLEARTRELEEDPDRLFADKCIVEGSAEHASGIYQAANPEIARKYLAEQATPAAMARQMRVLTKVPAYLILGTLLQYQLGPAFVDRAVGEDYVGGMTALYEAPPVSQEQVIHPDRFFGDMQDWPQKIVWSEGLEAAAGPGWTSFHDLPLGELDMGMWIDHFLSPTKGKLNPLLLAQGRFLTARSLAAAEGWDAGRSHYLAQGATSGLLGTVTTDQPLIVVQALAFDTAEDAAEAAETVWAALEVAYGLSEATWADSPTANGEGGARQVEAEGPDGRLRLRQEGTRVFLLDGAPEATFEALWAELLATRFERDERDTWDPAQIADPFEGLGLVVRDAGLGVALPEGWTGKPASGLPGLVAEVEGPGLAGTISLVPAPSAQVRPLIEAQLKSALGREVSPDGEIALPVGDALLYRFPNQRLVLATAGRQTLLVRLEETTPGALAEHAAAVEAFLRGIVVR